MSQIIPFCSRASRLRTVERLEWYAAFGNRLRVTRALLGITEQEAAAVCLTTLRTYRKREAGLPHRNWYYGHISFAQTYDLSYAWLLAGAGNMYNSPPDDDGGGGKPIPKSIAA